VTSRGARQRHGFQFQDWIAKKFFDLSYTGQWDIHEKMNPEGKAAGPISIKTAKWRTPIGLGDALRQFDIKRDFTIVVGFWEYRSGRKQVIKVVVAKVAKKTWRGLWGRLTRPDLERLDSSIKDRSVGHDKARDQAKGSKAALASKGHLIVLNPKIDSKGQRRWQCSLPFAVFFSQIVGEQYPQPDRKPMLWGEAVDVTFS